MYDNMKMLNDEIEHLEAELKQLQDTDTSTDSPAYKEVEQRLHDAYQNLDNV